MRPILLICIIVLSTSCTLPSCRTISGLETDSQPFTHEQWTNLLQKHVNPDGWVNYDGFIKDSLQLNNYLQQIESNYPNEKNWNREQILAYWINAYNAYTVQIVIRNYPVASIKDIKPGVAFLNSVWDIKFITIEGEQLDLNNIEHNILRKMNEPRIHFAVNCASYSCPKLLNTAYEAATIDNQLNQQAIDFINDPKRNVITAEKADVSSIFNWFTGDFTNDGSLKDFLNKYSKVPITENTGINFLEYNWNLNKQ